MRPITLFTGQWADLTFEEMCKTASEMGYEGLELATWGNHINPKKAAEDNSYIKQVKDTLKKYDLKAWAISGHLCGQLDISYRRQRTLISRSSQLLWVHLFGITGILFHRLQGK